ncbi:DNA topoisomerase IV subunit B [Enterobacteriaceae endosymbiont of Plateumaris braccata]|uniref:DNA topoisomerase IV subunit B n=1 Tax=Enterobacteriaceae endosymbiont of Plateumaris braccata TaxID=2675793 RepID=UPI001448C99A|nr:DNA topoisomerase IV subunit B [Enterobacteriaceae endosymbiont of Plateumaris braccata]QJC28169.1 DNA topoisomerase IV subunit B [Enterobacteriaceae endosymbiont of Plateumaris braccata]
MNNSNKYNADAIEVLEGLDPVRRRPGMYTDLTRPNHLGQEIIDNSVDEALSGYAKNIEVILYKDQSLEVIDDGRGMPVDIHPQEKIPAVELILCRLHSGSKFSNKNYNFSGGLHGVGISVVNALSKKMKVTIFRHGKVYTIIFKNGYKIQDLQIINNTKIVSTGTKIRFWPNKRFFDHSTFLVSSLINLLKAKAVLCPGLQVYFKNKNTQDNYHWHYKDGLSDYLSNSIKNFNTIPKIPFKGECYNDKQHIDWALFWVPENHHFITESYVNLIPTTYGGTHVNGLRLGLLDAMRNFCHFHNILPRNIKLLGEDIWSHCSYVLSIKIQDPQFTGQTKERLSSRQCTIFVSNIIRDAFILWLNQNIEIGTYLANMVISNAQKRIRESKKLVKKKNSISSILPGKLADCIIHNSKNTELFLVEGDSAGGSAKQARDKYYQAVMPLKGKILNTWEINSEEILSSQEIYDISLAIGICPNNKDLKKLRYNKICILADADSDGLHIATLLCALFIRHFFPLVKEGHIYVAMPPLYRIDLGKEVFYALDENEKITILNKLKNKKNNINVQRFKGLGEMNPIQLRETTLNPVSRRLVQLIINNTDTEIKESLSIMDMLLSKKRSEDRRKWLQKKGDISNI